MKLSAKIQCSWCLRWGACTVSMERSNTYVSAALLAHYPEGWREVDAELEPFNGDEVVLCDTCAAKHAGAALAAERMRERLMAAAVERARNPLRLTLEEWDCYVNRHTAVKRVVPKHMLLVAVYARLSPAMVHDSIVLECPGIAL